MTVTPLPLRQLVKVINALYCDKMAFPKEVQESLMAHAYNMYINKYGLLNVAERKLKEMMLSVALCRSKYIKVELFARFMGLSHVGYTPDDLQFLFVLAQLLLQK